MRFFTSIYILLLVYIIAALVFWGISLNKSAGKIFEQERLLLNVKIDSNVQPALYQHHLQELSDKRGRRKSQYIGEGSTFLLIILIGAAVVYSSFRRSISLSKQQNNFMLAVTHELKSPIAAVKLNLQTLERHQLDEEKKNLLVKRCISESNRLNDLCNNMLIASQMEGRQYVALKEDIDFAALVEESLKDYKARYNDRIVKGEFTSCILAGDKLLLHMAVNNLLENAIKYTPSDKPITVSLKSKNNMCILQVADNGPGIPDNEKGKIFNKFYRIGSEETRKTKGTGLGLYLTSKIMKQHKGKIYVKDNTPSGAIFEICIPAIS
jgi:signal transduction histidine kinase